MSIRRGPVPADSFTIISNAWLRDPRLSLKEKGLLAYISSHAAGYRLSTEQIIAESTDGRDAVRAGMAQLEQFGYLRRIPLRNEDGRAAGYDFELTDPPVGFTGAGKPVAGHDQGERDVSAGHDQSGFSGAGEPATKKTTSQKTKKTTSASPRGTRLPDDWRPSDSLLDWARQNAPGIGWSEHEKFVDHFKSAPGQRGVKLDWDAAWRNWMRRASEQRGTRPVSGPPAAPRAPQFKNSEEQAIERKRIRAARAKVLDALMEQGRTFDQAKAEIADLTDADFLKLLDTNTATGYIDGDVIDSTQRPEVES